MEISTVTTPEWVKDAIFYQILPDRFAMSTRVAKPNNLEPWDVPPTSHGFKGGDLLGVVEHLDYLQDLGINAIYFNPVFASTANHRYHTYDYYRVDPLLGGNDALDILLNEAHRLGMHVILDGVFNHASRGFFQFNHILENGPQSPYLDWFHIRRFPLNAYCPECGPLGYEAWWDLPALPKFNIATPAVRTYLLAVAQHWIRVGSDGWRLDVAAEINDDAFWQEFRRLVKGMRSDAYIVGEIWEDAQHWLQGDQFDGVTNYPFTRAVLGFVAGAQCEEDLMTHYGDVVVPRLDAPQFKATIERLLGLYSWEVTLAQLNPLGSHDTPRFASTTGNDLGAYRLATLFQMTYPGAPCIYYGDEIGLLGGPDPDCRAGFPWDEGRWDEERRAFTKRCIALRHRYPVLRRGNFVSLYADRSIYAYARQLGTHWAVVALNASEEECSLDLTLPPGPCPSVLFDPWSENRQLLLAGRLIGWHVPARTGRVLLGQVEAE
jgi:cyclomaltodextrinase